MKKLFVYSNQNDNNSLGQLAHLLINKGVYGFTVDITRLSFNVNEENVTQLDEQIREILGDEIYFISVA